MHLVVDWTFGGLLATLAAKLTLDAPPELSASDEESSVETAAMLIGVALAAIPILESAVIWT